MKKICLIFALSLYFCNLNAQISQDTSLIAFYPFNKNASDESGNGNHGIVNGAVLTSDRFNADSAAYEFNGHSSFISIPDSPGLQSPADELTQIAWIYIYGWSQVGAAFGPVLMKSNSGENAFQYRLSVSNSGVNTAVNHWENAVTVFETFDFNTWYMIASTLRNDTVRADVNGLYTGEGTLTGPAYPDSKPLEIGRDVPGATEVFYGKIDDIRIYNRALNDAEIRFLFDGSLGFSSDKQFANPKELILFPNHPDPFNRYTELSWYSASDGCVVLKVYDITGREIRTLANEKQQPGEQKVIYDATSLPAGIYFYRLQVDGVAKTRKMILLN